MIIQFNVLQHLVDLVLLLSFGYSLKVAKYIEMLSRGKVLEKDVVLGADPQELPHIIHLIKEIHSENLGIALS